MPAYANFYRETQKLSPTQRGEAFVANYASKYPDFYLPSVFGDTAKLKARAIRFFDPRQPSMFPGLPPLDENRVLVLAKTIGPQFAQQQQRFSQTFSDFSCNSEVEFAPSLVHFDGHPETVNGKSYLLFGVDVIALLHGPTDMPAFFDHELFHLYHDQVVGNVAPAKEYGWWDMWREGLATYVSQRMNPGLDAQHVLWYPADIVARMTKEGPRGASLFLADIDKANPDAYRWFLANKSVDGLPQRAGYYFGLRFAQKIGAGKPLADLARMDPVKVRKEEIAFLKSLARS